MPSALNLTIFPSTAYLTVKPGTKITHRVLLKYDGTTPIQVTPQLLEFATDGLTGIPLLQKQTSLSWISLKNPSYKLGAPFALQPGQQVELILEIAPPRQTPIAETPLSLVLTTVPTTHIVYDGGSAQTLGAIASNIIVSVQNDFANKGQLQIDQVKLPRLIDSFATLKFNVLAKNVGRNAVAAAGELKLTHLWSGKELKHWYIYPDVILANKTRSLRTLLTDPKTVKTDADVKFADLSYKPPFLIGPYQLTVDLTSANQTTTHQPASVHQRSQTVFAFPFSLIVLLLLGLILYRVASTFQS